jgi:hypothetical protein
VVDRLDSLLNPMKQQADIIKSQKEMMNKYRLVFQGSPMSKEVFANVLKTFHIGEELPPEDVVSNAVANCGWAILRDIGITQDDIVKALVDIVPTNREE